MRNFPNTRLLLIALCSVWLSPVNAQTDKGIVTGRVVDTKGGVLQGALVDLQPSGATSVTNNQGEFKIVNLAPGAQ